MTSAPALRDCLGGLVDREGGGPPDWPERLAAFLERLARRNRHVNLISRRTASRVVENHVVPSLATLRLVCRDARLRVLDIGSGGGFPAIPLKILRPRVRLDLVEAVQRKCDFLSDVIRELELLDCEVHWGRVEASPASVIERAPFELAFARAVGDRERLGKSVEPLLDGSGGFWVFENPDSPDGVVGEPKDRILWTDSSGAPVTALRRMGSAI
jgi:16S rRNA (guanine527-N7)-methyltransferase